MGLAAACWACMRRAPRHQYPRSSLLLLPLGWNASQPTGSMSPSGAEGPLGQGQGQGQQKEVQQQRQAESLAWDLCQGLHLTPSMQQSREVSMGPWQERRLPLW